MPPTNGVHRTDGVVEVDSQLGLGPVAEQKSLDFGVVSDIDRKRGMKQNVLNRGGERMLVGKGQKFFFWTMLSVFEFDNNDGSAVDTDQCASGDSWMGIEDRLARNREEKGTIAALHAM